LAIWGTKLVLNVWAKFKYYTAH